jgi:hypothetical protein
MEGKEFLVAPMVMIREGVHQGSNGALYYPRNELSKTPEVWNYKPVVVYHPTMNGYGVSACDVDVISSRKVGVIMNTKFDKETGKLRAEAWLEVDRIHEVDSRIAETLNSGEIMELSTGLFTDNELSEGEFEGKSYKYIARNYRPDHLALLPDKVGACSVADGAGLLQLNESQKDSLTVNLEKKLGQQIAIQDVVTSKVVYSQNEKLFQVDVSFTDGEFLIDDESLVEVTKSYTPEISHLKGESQMSAVQKIVDGLIANEGTEFSDDDRESLLLLNEDVLQKLQPVVNEVAEAEVAEEVEVEETETEEVAEVEEVIENENLSVEEYVANAPPEIRDMLEAGLASHQRDRQALIDVVVANEKNVFEQIQLNEKSISELKGLAALAAKDEVVPTTQSYAGAAAPSPVQNSDEEAPLLIPTMNWSE